jgi:hypothetical protein
MSRSVGARLAIAESFLGAAAEAGLDAATVARVAQVLAQAHRRYPTPPPGWYDDYDEALAVADHHTKQARAILDTSILDHTMLAAGCRGTAARVRQWAQEIDDARR